MDKESGFDNSSAIATAEMVTDGHPDKFCDQVADAVLDAALKQDPKTRAGIECLAKDHLLIVSGEMSTRANLDVEEIARVVWESVVGYGPGNELPVGETFRDLRPQAIIEYLGLQKRDGWTYCSTAAFGHYGRGHFPWERPASAVNAAHG